MRKLVYHQRQGKNGISIITCRPLHNNIVSFAQLSYDIINKNCELSEIHGGTFYFIIFFVPFSSPLLPLFFIY